ncbi:MAG: arylsulfatase [Planctomycetota bacterium]|nr:MAG: arylsulfatase [Planctomycetota bacterium]
MTNKPNVILILNDDMGYSDLGCYGGEIETPNLDWLAKRGLRYTQFYNTARCCPSRASLLTGMYPQQADVGHMIGDDGIDGYLGNLSNKCVTIAEALKLGGYSTYMSGKWHVTKDIDDKKDNWPNQRGFEDFYGILGGAASYYEPRSLNRNNERIDPPSGEYYLTDAISDEAIRQIKGHNENKKDQPFFQYVAYTAPHWPLHAYEEDIKKYKGRFDAGWDDLRKERLERMVAMGIINESWRLTERDSRVEEWENAKDKSWQARRMEVYAAQIDRMDQGIGRIVDSLKETNSLENTLIIFLADNGGCAEEISEEWGHRIAEGGVGGSFNTRDGREVRYGNTSDISPGGEDTYASYGIPWANVSNTPFRLYKHWVHEGGISTPFIAHWPSGIKAQGELRQQPAQLPDVMATILDIAGIEYPKVCNENSIKPLEGVSMVPTFTNQIHEREVLYWEHEGNKAIRKGKWKLVLRHPNEWELYDIEEERTELNNVSKDFPDVVNELTALYEKWAEKCEVKPWEELLELRRNKEA